MGYVYRHVRLDKNEVFYVGIGLTNDEKYTRAYSKKGRNNIWKGITSRVEYKVEVFFEDDCNEVIREKEKEFIALYGRIDLNTGTLCNLTDGGDGSVNLIVSEETRRKQSESRKGKKHTEEAKKNMSMRQKGRVMSDETKEKLRILKTGTKLSQEVRNKMSFDRSGEKHPLFGKSPSKETREKWSKTRKGRPSINKIKVVDTISGKIYDSVSDAIIDLNLNISPSHLRAMIRGVYNNWTSIINFCDYNESEYINTLQVGRNINPNDKLIVNKSTGIFFTSVEEAYNSLSLKISKSHFNAMLNGKYPNKTSCTYV